MISSAISQVSALVILIGGLALLFASDVLLPTIAPGFPPGAAWLGQLLAAAWLGIAAMNWLQQTTTLGGIYGRPVVLANFTLYFVTATSVVRALAGGAAPRMLWLVLLPTAVLAIVYGALLLRGPFDALGSAAK